VKWTCERSEAFLSDYQGRDLTVEAELALDKEGNFLAVRGSNLSNLGGHAADALAELGVSHIEMPATPERVWRATRAGRSAVGG
jgi:CO/xanthine dehydrogenase Mo-binding subunit